MIPRNSFLEKMFLRKKTKKLIILQILSLIVNGTLISRNNRTNRDSKEKNYTQDNKVLKKDWRCF